MVESVPMKEILGRRMKLIFCVELLIELIDIVRIIVLAIWLGVNSSTFEDIFIQSVPNSQYVLDSFWTIVKFAFMWWGLWVIIDIIILITLFRGWRQERRRLLRRWVIIGWIIIGLVGLNILLNLIYNVWWKQTFSTVLMVKSMVYVLFRIWANLVTICFVDEIKRNATRKEDEEIRAEKMKGRRFSASMAPPPASEISQL